jgi:hypothetical protein
MTRPAVPVLIVLAAVASAATARAATVTVAPAKPAVLNCYPFGAAHPDTWPPYAGWIYKNVPPFTLEPGDILAFDLGLKNDYPMQLDIAMAKTAANGSMQEGEPFVTLVKNTQSPSSQGDTVIGNFEVQYKVEAAFAFAGGGLIIRFANPSEAYKKDPPCDQVQVKASVSDPSGQFLFRVFNDVDGKAPWGNGENDNIGGFRVITRDRPLAVFLKLPLAVRVTLPIAALLTLWGVFRMLGKRKARKRRARSATSTP